MGEIIERFRLGTSRRGRGVLRPPKLDHVNGEWMRGLAVEGLHRPHGPPSPRPWKAKTSTRRPSPSSPPLVQGGSTTLGDVPDYVDWLFLAEAPIDEASWEEAMVKGPDAAGMLDDAIAAFADVRWTAEALRAPAGARRGPGPQAGQAQAPVWVSVTGRTWARPVPESLVVFGRERTLERLRAARPAVSRRSQHRAPRWLRVTVRVVAAVAALLALYLVVTFAQVWWTSRQDDAVDAQAIVVLERRSTRHPVARLPGPARPRPRAVQAGSRPTIVVTGGNQPGDRFTGRAPVRTTSWPGVPEQDIRREVDAQLVGSLAAVARIPRRRGVDEVILVSDPYHSFRVGQIARELGMTRTLSHPDQPRQQLQRAPVDGAETMAVSIGRFVGYRRLVPASTTRWAASREVWAATDPPGGSGSGFRNPAQDRQPRGSRSGVV